MIYNKDLELLKNNPHFLVKCVAKSQAGKDCGELDVNQDKWDFMLELKCNGLNICVEKSRKNSSDANRKNNIEKW